MTAIVFVYENEWVNEWAYINQCMTILNTPSTNERTIAFFKITVNYIQRDATIFATAEYRAEHADGLQKSLHVKD